MRPTFAGGNHAREDALEFGVKTSETGLSDHVLLIVIMTCTLQNHSNAT